MIIYLRPHHLMCMQNFIGKGYSAEFTDNMANIIDYLKNHADEKIIKVVKSEDNICDKCPNKGSGKCLKAIRHDRDYFTALHMDIATNYSWNDIKELIKQHINYKTFTNICSDCQWFSICDAVRYENPNK